MEELALKISKTLKTLRQERGWSLDMASKKTGVSKAMLGQIERGESSPTIATLWKIIGGFNVSFSKFVNISPTVTAAKVHPKNDKILIRTLFEYDKELNFEMFIIELLPGCEHISSPHQNGVIEHIIVTSGEIEVFIDGAWHSLKQNAGLRFKADQKHGYRNNSHSSAIFHNIIHYF